jgi:hypothetical protein
MKLALFLAALLVCGCGKTPPVPTTPESGPLTGALLTEYAPRVAKRGVYDDAARGILEDPEVVTLYSVKPADFRKHGYRPRDEDWRSVEKLVEALGDGEGVLGSLVLEDRKQLGEIVGRVYRGFFDVDRVAGCFDPRHALVFRRGDVEVAALICFECHYLVVFNPHGGKVHMHGFIQADLETLLNGLLRAADIPIAP